MNKKTPFRHWTPSQGFASYCIRLSGESINVYKIWSHLSAEFSKNKKKFSPKGNHLYNLCLCWDKFKRDRQLQKSTLSDEKRGLLPPCEKCKHPRDWDYFKIQIIVLTMVSEFIQMNKCACNSQGQFLLWKQMDPIFHHTPQRSALEWWR